MIPDQKDIEMPLLEVLVDLGGQGKPKDIYSLVTKKFPKIRDEDLAETLPSGGKKWTNRIQWVRQKLVSNQEIDGSNFGSWRITEKGRQRLLEQYENYQTSFRNTLLYRINSLEPFEFEQFAQRLLEVYGYVNMEVTRKSKDGGIDGHGKLKVGLAMMKVAFQCKKWQEKNNVEKVPLYAYYERPSDIKETIDEDEVRMPVTKGLKLDDYRK